MERETGRNRHTNAAKMQDNVCQRFFAPFKKNINSKLAFTTYTGYNSQYKSVSNFIYHRRIVLQTFNQQSFPRLGGSPETSDRLAFLPYPMMNVIKFMERRGGPRRYVNHKENCFSAKPLAV